ncbi:MAG: UbiA family prenyltransferase [Nitrososphaeria archaeon]|jgi:geranylgeranylglycerol-phosphate geranylgeranyltransferase
MLEILSLIKARLSVIVYVVAFDATLLTVLGLRILPSILIISTLSVYLISLANYTLSDLLDLEEDRINNPKRPLASGKVSKRTAQLFIIALYALAFILGYFINLLFDAFLLVSAILAYAYSGNSIRAKSKWWSKIGISGLGAFIAPLTVISITGFSIKVILMALILMLWAEFSINLGDIFDYEGDKKTGVITFAVAYGKDNAINLLKVLLVAQLVAETALLISFKSFNLLYMGFSLILFAFFMKKVSVLKRPNLDRNYIKQLKNATRVMVIVLQLITLSFIL